MLIVGLGMLSGTYPSYGQTTLEGIMLMMTTGSLSVATGKQKSYSQLCYAAHSYTYTDRHAVHIHMYVRTYHRSGKFVVK